MNRRFSNRGRNCEVRAKTDEPVRAGQRRLLDVKAAQSHSNRSSRVVRLELVLSAEQVAMAKQAAARDSERYGDGDGWRGVLVGIALNAIAKRLPERAGVLDEE